MSKLLSQPDHRDAGLNRIQGDSQMSARTRAFCWEKTALGPIDGWPASLVSTVNFILGLPMSTILMAGPELITLYNDTYIPTLAERHPEALGMRGDVLWADAWEAVGHQIEAVHQTGISFRFDNVLIPVQRDGVLTDTYFTYSFSPIFDGATGGIAGVMCMAQDVTPAHKARLTIEATAATQEFLLKLSDAQRAATKGRDIMQISAELLGRHLNVERVGYSEAAADGRSMSFETGWVQGTLKTLSGSVPMEHWSEDTSADFHRGRTVVYPDVRTEPSLASEVENYEAIGAIAVVAAPFLRRGVWRGSLYVNHSKPRQWTAQEVGLIEQVAQRTAEAMERAQAEEEVRALAGRLGMAQEAGKMASWQWDLNAGTFVWDGGSEWTYGRPPSEMTTPEIIFTYLHEDDRDKVRRDLVPALEGTGEYRSEFRVYWPDGSLHWILGFGKTMRDEHGVPCAIVGININVTEQKKAEATLMQTEKLAAVGRLASTMAHEINNPLEAVTNLLYLARQAESMDEMKPLLETADAELRRAASITSQALRFHRQATKPTLCSFELLTEDLFNGRHARLRNVGASVECRDRTSRPVLCFEGEVHQVLNNLVANAIDALSGTGGRLLLRGRDGVDWKTGRAGMVLTVADTGAGMSPVTRMKLFDAFFTTKGVGGSGLGLWVSKEIIARHAGRLRLRSRQGGAMGGTVFTMFLPYEAVVRSVVEG